MNNLCVIIVTVLMFAIPILSVTFFVKWVRRKPKKKIGYSILLCFVGIFVFSLIGSHFWLKEMTPEERSAYEAEQQIKAEQREAEKEAERLAKETETVVESEATEVEVQAETEKYTSIPAETEIEETTEPQEVVTFDEIYKAYKENELRADDKYKGNRYRITCTVYDIGDGGLNGLFGDLSVSAYTYSGNTKCVLWCTFDEKTQREGLSKVNMGDEITFEGYCSSWGNWYDCELVG